VYTPAASRPSVAVGLEVSDPTSADKRLGVDDKELADFARPKALGQRRVGAVHCRRCADILDAALDAAAQGPHTRIEQTRIGEREEYVSLVRVDALRCQSAQEVVVGQRGDCLGRRAVESAHQTNAATHRAWQAG